MYNSYEPSVFSEVYALRCFTDLQYSLFTAHWRFRSDINSLIRTYLYTLNFIRIFRFMLTLYVEHGGCTQTQTGAE